MNRGEQFFRQYAAELDRLLGGAGEDALSGAYELGRPSAGRRARHIGRRRISSRGDTALLRLQEMTAREAPAALVESASSLLIEALSPFEMSYRAVDEANTALRRLNELLEGEAKRIAHALHDQASSIVASAALELDLALGELPDGAREQLVRVRQLLDETGEQLRHLARAAADDSRRSRFTGRDHPSGRGLRATDGRARLRERSRPRALPERPRNRGVPRRAGARDGRPPGVGQLPERTERLARIAGEWLRSHQETT